MNETADLDAIFAAAIEIASPADRADYIARQCGSNASLKDRVDELVAAHFRAGEFLESPQVPMSPTIDWGIHERPGATIGRYKLLEQIGEGGFAIVFMAEQEQPVRRRVAVKIIKAGMDTRQIIARFEAERQALAMMDHPSIAKVFDGGTTDSGRPYFVMELVKGLPITEYCDQQRLNVVERLEVFNQVCQAVQHAHQKGVIHRDIKPSNVLVSSQDNRALAKVIDFGIAKATGAQLTDRTLFTDFRQLIGTPAYMSPEQALGSLDIDTRSDVYSLGVLLYELLAGSPPFDPKALWSKAFAEMQRTIREVEPPAPSRRLSDSASLAEISAHRNLEPAHLANLIRGELDWIVMKCLDKDRNRRYDTAIGLVSDLDRYLRNEPVQACPPSTIYRLRKFASRHRGPVIASSIVILALLIGAAFSLWQAVRARQAENLAIGERDAKEVMRREAVANAHRAQAVSDFLVQAFRSPSPKRDGRSITIAEVLHRAANDVDEKFANDPATKGELLHAIGESYRGLGLHNESVPLLEEAYELRVNAAGPQSHDTFRCARDLSWAYMLARRSNDARPLLEKNLRLASSTLGSRHQITLQLAYDLATCYFNIGRHDDSSKLIKETFELQQATLGRDHPDTVESMYELARNTSWAGRLEEAVALYEEVFTLAATHPHQLYRVAAMQELAVVYSRLDRFEEALPLIDQAVELNARWLGPEHLGYRNAQESRAAIYGDLIARLTNAADLQRRDPERALQLAQTALPLDPKPCRAWRNLGWAEYRLGHWQACIDAMQKSCQHAEDGVGEPEQWYFLAMANWQLGRKDQAKSWYQKATDWMGENAPANEEFLRFRDEAAELLKMSMPDRAR